MNIQLVINLLLVIITMIVMIAYLIKLNKESELKKITPIKFKILKYYGKDKKTEVTDITEAFYVDVKSGFTSINKLKLRERLSYNQDEILVHCGGGDYLAYKEYKAYISEEYDIAMFQSFSHITFLTVLAIIWILSIICFKEYSKSEYAIKEADYELGVINENLDSKIIDVNKEFEGMGILAVFNMAYEVLGIMEYSEPETVQEYQTNILIAEAREAFLTGENPNIGLLKTGLPIRDFLYSKIRDYKIEQGILFYNAMYNGSKDNADVIDNKYVGYVYAIFLYHALYYVITILSVMLFMYKFIMYVIYKRLLRKYQERLGV